MERSARWQGALYLPLTILAWAGVIVVAGWLLSHVAHALLVLVLSVVLAFAVTPLAGLLARWMPRSVAIAAAYLIGFVVVFGLLAVVVVTAATEIASLVHSLPAYGASLQQLQPALLRLLRPLGIDESQLTGYRSQAISYLQSAGATAAADVFGAVRGTLNAMVDAVLVIILSIYVTARGPAVTRWMGQQVPSARPLIGSAGRVVGGYVRGTLIMATLVGVLVGAGMGVLGVRYALLLGVIAFFMEFIPVLGVFISGALCVALALFQGWLLAIVVVVYFVVIHVIEGDVVGPRVLGRAVGVHPALSLIALVAASEVFGLWGALFGAPIAGLIQATATFVWKHRREGPAVTAESDSPPPAAGEGQEGRGRAPAGAGEARGGDHADPRDVALTGGGGGQIDVREGPGGDRR